MRGVPQGETTEFTKQKESWVANTDRNRWVEGSPDPSHTGHRTIYITLLDNYIPTPERRLNGLGCTRSKTRGELTSCWWRLRPLPAMTVRPAAPSLAAGGARLSPRINRTADGKTSGKGGRFAIALQEAAQHSLEESVLLVHDPRYVEWLERFYAEWAAQGQPAQYGDADCGLLPDTFAWRGHGGCACRPTGTLQQAGWWFFDRNAPVCQYVYQLSKLINRDTRPRQVVEHTHLAARTAVDTAITAAKVLATAAATDAHAAAYALCRPPGHHAGRESGGGLCYYNNAVPPCGVRTCGTGIRSQSLMICRPEL
jgi:hypothetical protein